MNFGGLVVVYLYVYLSADVRMAWSAACRWPLVRRYMGGSVCELAGGRLRC